MSAVPVTDVLIAARNCEARLAETLAAMPHSHVRSVVVVDNGSSDATAAVARDGGAVVLREPNGGRGAALLRGLAHLEALPRSPDVVVFMAGDGSDDPADIPDLVAPIRDDNMELVIGVRPGPVNPSTAISLKLIGALYRHRFQDLGSFRAIRYPALVALGVRDRADGWDTEMQVKALKLGLRIAEVPVTHTGGSASNGVLKAAARTGRSLFQILRHATAR